jgi:hypothetical protein
MPVNPPPASGVAAFGARAWMFSKLAATVLEKILGPRLAIAYLNDRLEQQTDPIRRERLSRLLHQIKPH